MIQYYPRVDAIEPAQGSIHGGTQVTITGGGFALDDSAVAVSFNGRVCTIVDATAEQIICNTSSVGGNTSFLAEVFSPFQLSPSTHPESSPDFVVPTWSWFEVTDVVGNWSSEASGSAHNQSYYVWNGEQGIDGDASAWITFSPSSDGAVLVSGMYSLKLRVPDTDMTCSAAQRASNVSVIIRAGGTYAHVVVDLRPRTSAMETDDTDPNEEDVYGLGRGGFFVDLGYRNLVAGGSSFVTLETVGAKGCVAADAVLLSYLGPITSGCTDPLAENFDASISEDDGSCIFIGGRGLASASWSSMAAPFKLDNWYPKHEGETWGSGDFCKSPSGATAYDLDSCLHGDCFLHQQCGANAFCCVHSNYSGCQPTWTVNNDVDEDGWKLVFRHDKSDGGSFWTHSMLRTSAEIDPNSAYSILDELEDFRRPSDGRFEFKACWPNSGFASCMHWIQRLNPFLNPDATNMDVTCVDCPYSADADPDGDAVFRGIQYSGTSHILDGDSDGNMMQFGAEEGALYQYGSYWWQTTRYEGFWGPQEFNDAGEREFPLAVELFVRPQTEGEACIRCEACYDSEGTVRMATFLPSAGGASYIAPACPDKCLVGGTAVPSPMKETKLRATHQLVIASEGFAPRPCVEVVGLNSENSTTVCEGVEVIRTDAVPASQAFGHSGGIRSHGLFVAPVAANYTFHAQFSGGGELWVSPNADPRGAERIFSSSFENGAEEMTPCKSRYLLINKAFSDGQDMTLNLREVQLFDTQGNLIPPESASMSSEMYSADRCIDGSTWTYNFCHTQYSSQPVGSDSWFKIDLGRAHEVGRINIYNRVDCCGSRTVGTTVSLYTEDGVVDGDTCASWDINTNQAEYTWESENMLSVSDENSCGKWSCLGGRCFRKFGARKSFDGAEAMCATFGSHLSAPQSLAEQTELELLADGDSIWLGLSDRNMESRWTFSDGSSAGVATSAIETGWKYSNFYSGEPNDWSNNENCIVMRTDGKWNDVDCATNLLPFVCEHSELAVDDNCEASFFSSGKIHMEKGDVRYVEFIGFNDEGSAGSLLTLTVDNGTSAFTTSEVIGLSAEFFREARTDAPIAQVVVNGLTAACSDASGVACRFAYSREYTPIVASIEPAFSESGVTAITLTGSGFSRHPQLNAVTFGGAPCVVSASNGTFIVCTIPQDKGVAGTFEPRVQVYNRGRALVKASHTVRMVIDTITPVAGSLYGGLTLTITGSGFASFGLHNQVKLLLGNASDPRGDATVSRTADFWDDDWIWGRGTEAHNASRAASRFHEVLCVPRTLKNVACRQTAADSGRTCRAWLAYGYDPVREREDAELFDFSTPKSIQCTVEALAAPLPWAGRAAAINVTVVNTTTLEDAAELETLLALAKEGRCSRLEHCEALDEFGVSQGFVGEGWRFDGAVGSSGSPFQFAAGATPRVSSVHPDRAMPGQVIDIHGSNLDAVADLMDSNWCGPV